MFRNLRILLPILLAVTLSACSGVSSENPAFGTLHAGRLDVALYPGFAPVVFHDEETGEIIGIDVDILQAFADQHDVEFNVIERPFSGIWELPARGEVDIAGSGISELDSRLVQGMLWSEPYYTVQRSLSIRAVDEERLRTIADFGGLTIGFTPGSTGEFDTRERAPDNTQLISYEIEEEAIADLLEGHIDAIARGDVSSRYDATVMPELGVTDVHYYNPREYFVFALPSDNSELQDALNRFLMEMTASGAIDAIIEKYLNP